MRPKLMVIVVSGFHLIPVICSLERAYLEEADVDHRVPGAPAEIRSPERVCTAR